MLYKIGRGEEMSKSGERLSGWSDLVRNGHFARLGLICTGVWLHAADGLMVATLIPSILADIGGAELVAWTIALYEIGSIAAGAASALLSLRYGLQRVMTLAALLYGGGCIVSAVAPDMPVMLVGRLLQGLGGGGLVALAFVAVNRLFPREQMPRIMAVMSILWGASAFSGPLVGGVFAELRIWRGGFWFFAVQALALSVWIFFGLRDQNRVERSDDGRIPVWRICVLALGVLVIAVAGIDVSPVRSPLLVMAGLAILALFLRMDGRRQGNRLLPVRPFDPRGGVGAALLMVFSFTAATIAVSAYGPVLMTILYGTSALVAGYILALSSIGWTVAAVATSGAPERLDRLLILLGMICLSVTIAGFMLAVPNGPLWLIAVLAFFEGVGFGMAWTFILRRATGLAVAEEKDRLASAIPTVQRLGYAVGAAYIGIVANAAGFADHIGAEAARSVGFWIFAGSLPLAGLGLAAAWAFTRPAAAAVAPSALRS
jgi:MFS family permease